MFRKKAAVKSDFIENSFKSHSRLIGGLAHRIDDLDEAIRRRFVSPPSQDEVLHRLQGEMERCSTDIVEFVELTNNKITEMQNALGRVAQQMHDLQRGLRVILDPSDIVGRLGRVESLLPPPKP